MDLTTLERAAVEKAATNKAVKGGTKGLTAGTHGVDLLVRINGTITKGEEYSQVIWPSVPILDVLIRMLDTAGCVQRAAFEAAVEAVLGGAKPFLTDEAGKPVNLKEWATEAVERLADAGETVCTGKTTASLSVEAVREPVAVEAEPVAEPVAMG